MLRHTLLIPTILVLLIVDTGFMTAASPAITITSPVFSAKLTTHELNITGTASNSTEEWHQTSQADFDTGTKNNLATNASGDLFLNVSFYDDFNDNNWDNNRWVRFEESNGITANEKNGNYNASRISNASTSGGCRCWTMSTKLFNNTISADWLYGPRIVDSIGATTMGFYKNANNYISVGIEYFGNNNSKYYYQYADPEGNSGNGILFKNSSESEVKDGPHNFRLTLDSDKIHIYLDRVFVGNFKRYFDNCNFYFMTEAWTNSSISACWDNVTEDGKFSGNFISVVHNMDYPVPDIKKVSWNATIPIGTNITVAVRSSDRPDMSNPTPWITVTNNQTNGLPLSKKYLQYNILFNSTDGITSPILHDISIVYDKMPIAKVEVSIDNESVWLPAVGKEDWHIVVNISENTNTIWARVTHLAGDFSIISSTVDVDTTPPVGTIVINNGDEFTNGVNVSLTLKTTDQYGVVSMKVSESPFFNAIAWRDYRQAFIFTLTPGDGKKTVYAKFKDSSGWESIVVNASVILDTTRPISAITPTFAMVEDQNFTVSWNGYDAMSGIFRYDLQYRDGNDPWTDWLTGTNATTVVFSGQDGHNYYFRLRAQDNAGNIQAYPDSAVGPVLVQIPKPSVSILRPVTSSTVHGMVKIEGTAGHQRAGMRIVRVMVQIDNGTWSIAQNTSSWQFLWDATNVKNGPHTINVKAFDGQNYSNAAIIDVFVDNEVIKKGVDLIPLSTFVMIIILTVAGTGTYLYLRKKR